MHAIFLVELAITTGPYNADPDSKSSFLLNWNFLAYASALMSVPYTVEGLLEHWVVTSGPCTRQRR